MYALILFLKNNPTSCLSLKVSFLDIEVSALAMILAASDYHSLTLRQ